MIIIGASEVALEQLLALANGASVQSFLAFAASLDTLRETMEVLEKDIKELKANASQLNNGKLSFEVLSFWEQHYYVSVDLGDVKEELISYLNTCPDSVAQCSSLGDSVSNLPTDLEFEVSSWRLCRESCCNH